MISQRERWTEGKQKSEPLPSTLREKLLRAREEIQSTRPA